MNRELKAMTLRGIAKWFVARQLGPSYWPTILEEAAAALSSPYGGREPIARGEGELVRDGTGLCELQMDEYVEAEEQHVHVLVFADEEGE